MAKAKKSKQEKDEKAEKKASPFKTRRTKETSGKVGDTLSPPADISEAIDAFREAQDQAKHFEGEATIYKDKILGFGLSEYGKRAYHGQLGSFKILGGESMVNFIVQDSSSGLTEEELEAFADKWGEEAAEALIVKDYASIRFDGKVLEANYDEVVKALQTLPSHVIDNLFKPMLMKASPGAVEAGRKHAKTPEELEELVRDLKIKNYIK